MKKFLLSLILITLALSSYSQDQETASLSIRVQQPERDYLTAPSCRLLQTKMTQILNQNGIVNDIPSNRFVMTAKANVLNKDVIAGSPSRISEQIEMTFIIGDVLDNIKYGSYVLTLTGVGLNEQQAIQMAIKSVKNNDAGMLAFIEKSKARIVQYYRDNETKILNQADVMVQNGNYNEAIYMLSMVPDASADCYRHCQDKMRQLMVEKINYDGETLLSHAKAAWAKNPNAQGAKEVYPIISSIDSRASCYKEVSSFLKQVTSKLVADEKREWEFKVKQYEDEKEKERREFEARQARDARDAAIRQQEIAAAREVAIEYARNLPDTVIYETNNTILLW